MPRAAAPGEQRKGDRPEERDDLSNERMNERPTVSRARARVGVCERQHNAAWTRAAAAVSRRRPRPRRCLHCVVERSLPPNRRDRVGCGCVRRARVSARERVGCVYWPRPSTLGWAAAAQRKEIGSTRGSRGRGTGGPTDSKGDITEACCGEPPAPRSRHLVPFLEELDLLRHLGGSCGLRARLLRCLDGPRQQRSATHTYGPALGQQ